jgi:protein phosphatase
MPGTGHSLHWRAYGLTDRGLHRWRNEDALLLAPARRLFAVADGLGGHAAGDVASRVAVASLAASFPRPPSWRIGARTLGRRLEAAFHTAHKAILDHAAADPACAGMGTTLTALAPLAAAPACVIAHIGDSRAYRLRGAELRQLTRDHTRVRHLVDAGMLTPRQARHHARASVLTRALGMDSTPQVDTFAMDAAPGDIFLLCSDGLTTMLEDADIARLLATDAPLEARCKALVAEANRRGGTDNITVVLATAE